MRIDLVAGIPDDAVVAEVVAQVQREAEFDDAEVAREMGRADTEHPHEFVAHFLRQLRQFLIREGMQIGGRRNP